MTKKKELDLSWTFCGRYGDDDDYLTIPKLPEDLSPKYQDVLRKLYEGNRVGEGGSADLNYSDARYWLERNNYLREVGNAWHHSFVFCPQVLKWLQKPNNNEATGKALRAQYT